MSWDLGFLAFGVLLIVGGWVLYRRGRRTLARSAAALTVARTERDLS